MKATPKKRQRPFGMQLFLGQKQKKTRNIFLYLEMVKISKNLFSYCFTENWLVNENEKLSICFDKLALCAKISVNHYPGGCEDFVKHLSRCFEEWTTAKGKFESNSIFFIFLLELNDYW